ncbi:MAG TPA: hypothetical protein VN538_12360 [Clostridia bacterium]|nr:hypothetical protein [Clostridia bacterium]
MKRLFRGLVILMFITIVCVIAYFLLSAMKKMYIESWFFLDRSVVIGFLSGLLLTFIISLVNYHHALSDHAQERKALLDAFAAEAEAFYRMIEPLREGSGAFSIPEQLQPELERALARLDDSAGKIIRGERLSPLKGTTIEKRGRFASKNAKSELAFDRAFVPFAESCNAAFHAHSILPYLKDEQEKAAKQEEFLRHLSLVYVALQVNSDMMQAIRAYHDKIDRFLGIRRTRRQET